MDKMDQPGHMTKTAKRVHYFAILLSMVFFVIQTGCKEKAVVRTPQPKVSLKTPAFDGNNAYAYVEKQLSFGYRVPGTEAHRNTVKWLSEELESKGAKVILQDFKADFMGKTQVPCTNIMGQFFPENKTRILLAAHFDSRMVAEKDDERQNEPIPGADDGASGVAVLLEIARILSENPLPIGVDILFFDAEDQGETKGKDNTWALGSQYWSNNIVPKGYDAKYGILLDMVGSEGAAFGKEELSRGFAREIQDKIWDLASSMGYSDYFQNYTTGMVFDDHLYVNRDAKIKMVDIINQSPTDRSSFGDYHHTHDDNLDIISARTLRVTGQVVTAVLFNESNGTF